MGEALYLRLSAPLQSWAGARTTGHFVRTKSHPTFTGLIGLIAASQGWKRGEWESWVYDTEFTVRIDDPGSRVKDYQIIANHPDEQEYRKRLAVCEGLKPKDSNYAPTGSQPDKSAVVVREYLAYAEFIVRVEHPTMIDRICDGFQSPEFCVYLGRKAFAPTFPFVLGDSDNALDSVPARKSGVVQTVSLRNNSRPVYGELGVCEGDVLEWASAA